MNGVQKGVISVSRDVRDDSVVRVRLLEVEELAVWIGTLLRGGDSGIDGETGCGCTGSAVSRELVELMIDMRRFPKAGVRMHRKIPLLAQDRKAEGDAR